MCIFMVHRTVPHKDIFTFYTCATCDYILHSPPFSLLPVPSPPSSQFPFPSQLPWSPLGSFTSSFTLGFTQPQALGTAQQEKAYKILLAETGLISSMIVISIFLYFLANSIISFLMTEKKKTPLCMYTTFYLPIPMLDLGLVYRLVIETISAININASTYM